MDAVWVPSDNLTKSYLMVLSSVRPKTVDYDNVSHMLVDFNYTSIFTQNRRRSCQQTI